MRHQLDRSPTRIRGQGRYNDTVNVERNQTIGAQNNTQRNRNVYQRHGSGDAIRPNSMRRTGSYPGQSSNVFTENGNRNRGNEYKMQQRIREPNQVQIGRQTRGYQNDGNINRHRAYSEERMQRWNEYNGRRADNGYVTNHVYRRNTIRMPHKAQYEQERATQRAQSQRWNEGFTPMKRRNEYNNGNKLNRITEHYETTRSGNFDEWQG